MASPTSKFHDPVAEAATVAAQLKDGNPANGEADVVVLLAHEGAAASTTSAADLEADPVFGPFVDLPADVDVIFSGHTHQEYALAVAKPGGGTRPVVQTGDYGEKLGKVTLTLDPTTKDVTGSTQELVEVVGYPANAAVAQIVATAKTNAATLGQEVIGSITADIKRDPNRATESVGANFIADVQLAGTKDAGRGGAQIALMNPGGVRNDFLFAPDGKVTYSEAFDVQSFSNDVFTKSYTGAQLKQVLEEQWQPAGAARPILALGVSKGFTFSYDPAAAQGSHIVASTMKLNGVTIDPAATYRVTINSFLATGGDNFTTLGGGTNQTTPGDNDLTMLVDYFRANSPVTADTAKRTTVYVPPSSTGYEPFASWTALVTKQYQDLLGRAPNSLELYVWVTRLSATTPTYTPGDLVAAILPFDVNATSSKVLRLYDGLLHKAPTDYWYATWISRLNGGASLAATANEFLKSPNPYKGLGNTPFVDALYRDIIRKPADPALRAGWIAKLNNGKANRGDVAAAFLESAGSKVASTPELKGFAVHLRMLGRMPTATEYGALRTGSRAGTLTVKALAEAVLASEEYAQRIAG
ncbi:5'-nucleotidase C-terminal domain-containing protein [Aquihabitans sp. G128]|uniref:5'-nucleotidase C-terminal domain-containing protein n=1 Tax=Aquihabitans sp. G128 TaxID=2849779 RepID=UPI001C2370F6|nr:5'-nucleotidase C-terminal domain-containing protein [Aquihabitans sp. G128]QXC59927.1 5'-nucleotidase C-terminal domain-containing protein [Aquihabitans sp. G128]